MKYIQKIGISKKKLFPASVLLTSIFVNNNEVRAIPPSSYTIGGYANTTKIVSLLQDVQVLPEEYPSPTLYYASLPDYDLQSLRVDISAIQPLSLSMRADYITMSGLGKPGNVETTTSVNLDSKEGFQSFKTSIQGDISTTDSTGKLISIKETTITGSSSVAIKLDSNGKFDYIEGKSETTYYEDGTYDYLEFKLEVVDDKKVPEVKPYEENEDTETITQIFENFKNETSYQLVNDYGGETFTVTDDVILSTSQDFMTGEARYSGYLEKNGGVIKFNTEDGELVPAAPFKEGLTLEDYLTFDLSPLIFTLSEDGTKLSANDFVDGLGGHFVGGSNGGLCYLNSLVFDISDGKISGMTYQADLSIFIGETSYSVVYGTADAPITIPSEVRTSLDNMSLEFDIPTNFSDCAVELWTSLVSMYGEEVALTIPYLYDETYHDGWDIETLETSVDGITWTPETIRVFESSASATSDYLERYATLLLENGYEEVEDNVYQKGIVRITFGATLLEGFTFTKVSE